MSTLILTAAVNMPDYYYKLFEGSLANVGYEGDIRFLQWNSWGLPLCTERVWIYYNFLRGCKPYDTVITTDMRDVLFQGNPSEIEHSGLDCFLESGLIRDEPYNRGWILAGFGEEGLGKIGDKPISCAGVVIGSHERMLAYYRQMAEYLENHPHYLPVQGNDQGLHNWLIHTGKLKCKLWENEYSPVYTVGLNPITVYQHKIYNQQGQLPPIIHQYDRHLLAL